MIGIDEAGRGAFAGPLVLAACKLKININELNDSKKLSAKKRENLYEIIKQNSDYLVVFVDNEYIDLNGIRAAYQKALGEIIEHFEKDELLFDGNTDYGMGIKTLINADEIEPCVMAASILAKVSRDNFMANLDDNLYDFKSHKGYGTKTHIEAIKIHGLSLLHRRSFCAKYSR
ncbi:ribonuclease HII [Campylobacter sp. RM12640]|uniref:ribonuclease HII n=1 Tax=unclassified Campylobacter TaxID=2593542 RepID=UPI001BDAEE9B|nr:MULTISPECIES: ribonuclease HII [unclassified Campylobacter]MBZ7976604.1 ribonuclease HII [Campylobacter sp. RM12637]MBZ7978761.1 ribonuclease HII [Campylobacter sp. RM12654]MBZ7982538.1 ribonuclease HII [Campylobacter sp. RM12640]MBZ7989741.1 ribonuclease HII [Campylobacter sp. RM12635]MBT0879499.1 ribonuclease HII [Campylobacter sp. 2018MI01]